MPKYLALELSLDDLLPIPLHTLQLRSVSFIFRVPLPLHLGHMPGDTDSSKAMFARRSIRFLFTQPVLNLGPLFFSLFVLFQLLVSALAYNTANRGCLHLSSIAYFKRPYIEASLLTDANAIAIFSQGTRDMSAQIEGAFAVRDLSDSKAAILKYIVEDFFCWLSFIHTVKRTLYSYDV